VHAAHTEGLNASIVGDDLYGTKADRLYLHAERLRFWHPVLGKEMEVVNEVGF
jgi:tRNA pseudouridine32 synthase/23S rRNA pseudouridine746 synthase